MRVSLFRSLKVILAVAVGATLFGGAVFAAHPRSGNSGNSGAASNQGNSSASGNSQGLDSRLLRMLEQHGVEQVDAPVQDSNKVILGQALFFDRILSGNRDTACATCHHPLTASADGLALGVGTGTETVGAVSIFRVRGEGRSFVPRNAPDIFNRGSVNWHTAFWDGRASIKDGVIVSPAGDQLPSELQTPLQIQAMFPVTSRDEMRGELEDVQAGNELAAIDDADFIGIWNALMARLMANEEYRQMFANAFPEVPESSLGFQHAAIAIAAFEAEAFGMNDSPFDQYLAGDLEALSHDAKRGAALFYGAAKCVSCHSGTLLTDQQHHNLAVPQLGPGKDPTSGLDFGRFGVTGSMSDLFEFRTPPLRNVTATGPWMHNGAFSSLEDVIRHHGDVGKSLEDYDPSVQIFQSDLREMVVDDESLNEWMLETVDTGDQDFDGNRVHFLMAFLESLTVPNLHERLQWVIPADVPSGLLEDGIPEVD